MSRKSRLTLWKERLGQLSGCPDDIFDKIEPSDELFARIENAENGDINSIRELATSLYNLYKDNEEEGGALSYFARMGVAQGDMECAIVALNYITRFNDGFDTLDDIISILNGNVNDESVERLIALAKVKKIILCASEGADFTYLTDTLADMYDEYSAYARIYIASMRLKHTGYYDKDKIDALAQALDVASVVTLPVFLGREYEGEKREQYSHEKEREAFKFALSLIDMDQWRDFWLKAIYEYSEIYLGSDITPFAEEIEKAFVSRPSYKEKKLHLLALRKYLCDKGVKDEDAEYTALRDKCLFDGLEPGVEDPLECARLIKEAVYLDGKAERDKVIFEKQLGNVILHTKNRYLLRATMTNHLKRGNKHLWEVTVSVKTDKNTAPLINPSRIVERRNEVTRGGVTLDKEKKVAQVLCRGEIGFTDKIYPLEMDLILDISYVSSTKCEYCDIRLKDKKRVGDYLVMQCSLAVY